MRVSFSILGKEIWCFHIQEELELVDWDELMDEFDTDDFDDEDEEEDEEEEDEHLVTLRWGEPCEFEREVFVP